MIDWRIFWCIIASKWSWFAKADVSFSGNLCTNYLYVMFVFNFPFQIYHLVLYKNRRNASTHQIIWTVLTNLIAYNLITKFIVEEFTVYISNNIWKYFILILFRIFLKHVVTIWTVLELKLNFRYIRSIWFWKNISNLVLSASYYLLSNFKN